MGATFDFSRHTLTTVIALFLLTRTEFELSNFKRKKFFGLDFLISAEDMLRDLSLEHVECKQFQIFSVKNLTESFSLGDNNRSFEKEKSLQ